MAMMAMTTSNSMRVKARLVSGTSPAANGFFKCDGIRARICGWPSFDE
jgi:hypothetical protein